MSDIAKVTALIPLIIEGPGPTSASLIKVYYGCRHRTAAFWSVCNHRNKLFLSFRLDAPRARMTLRDGHRCRKAEPENGHTRTTNKGGPAVFRFHTDQAVAIGALIG